MLNGSAHGSPHPGLGLSHTTVPVYQEEEEEVICPFVSYVFVLCSVEVPSVPIFLLIVATGVHDTLLVQR